MNSPTLPFVPDTAPFTAEQRAWLNGFFAGIFSGAEAQVQAPAKPLTILFGSQTGTSEAVAKQTAKAFRAGGFTPKVIDMSAYTHADLGREQHVLIVTSTYGEGEMPDGAKSFWEFLNGPGAPPLSGVEFCVLALGDTVYSTFCEAGKKFDARMEQLGAKRIYPRVDCDKDYEPAFREWLKGVQAAMGTAASAVIAMPDEEDASSSRKPQPARLAENRKLNADGSAKDTRHIDISLEASGLTYEVGDALGIMPVNCPETVDDILSALGFDGEEGVPVSGGQTGALRKALLEYYDVKVVPKPLLEFVAERAGDRELKKLLLPESKSDLENFLWGREVIDLLQTWPQVKFRPGELVGLLRKLQHRLYSISSSPKANPGRVHLTVGVVRYEAHGRRRKGICSTFLAERVGGDADVPVFIQPNKGFRLPANSDTPVIMVGPGTGVAPFRAFIQERRAIGAKGRNWLFFGDQRAGTDFLYREELDALLKEGSLTRLDTAFSRDQEEKVYVQHRMREHAKDLFAWLEQGAHFYVCGDATKMAKDVDKALHDVVTAGGGKSPEASAEYVKQLQKEKRYQRDVY